MPAARIDGSPADEALALLPATILAAGIADRSFSPCEAVDAVLRRIERLEPALNAMACMDPGAHMAARAAEAAVLRGDPLGPLHGVPVTIKDTMPVRGLPLRFGSRIHADDVAGNDGPVVERLRAAGAIVIGKTTTTEFGWSAVSHGPLTGATHNPWRPGLTAGGSSSGAAVAAAAGYGPLHQGADAGGSVRLPAHFCGVVGFKPSFGRVPCLPIGNNDYMSHVGPLARSVGDAALMFGAMAGIHPWDPTTLACTSDASSEALNGGVRGLRVAFCLDFGGEPVHREVAALAVRAARAFEELGAWVQPVAPPWIEEGLDLIRGLWPAHMAAHAPRLALWAERMDPGLVACIRAAEGMGLADYMALRARKYAYAAAIHRWFDDWDLLLTPTAAVAAFPIGALTPPDRPAHDWDWISSWAQFSYPFNIAHSPAVSVPYGFTPDGLPVGVQLVGRRLDDTGVLRAAKALEVARPWGDRRPPDPPSA